MHLCDRAGLSGLEKNNPAGELVLSDPKATTGCGQAPGPEQGGLTDTGGDIADTGGTEKGVGLPPADSITPVVPYVDPVETEVDEVESVAGNLGLPSTG